MRRKNILILLTASAIGWGGCAGSTSQPATDTGPHVDKGKRDGKRQDSFPLKPDADPDVVCSVEGDMRCDTTKTQEQTCKKDVDGRLLWGQPVPCPGGQCDSNKGKCIDPCDTVTCTAPPNTCYKSPGTCWNGDCKYDQKANGTACDDKDICTVDDKCTSGQCSGKSMVCNMPPRNTCKNTSTLTVYTSPGTCDKGKGSCAYGSADVPCDFGCDADTGTCTGDPCGSISCKSPPSACYKGDGLCVAGQCTYLPDDGKECDDQNPCTTIDKCLGGKCQGTLMACDTPPDSSCKDANTLTSFAHQGSCSGGQCSYPETEIPCAHGCDSSKNVCLGNPCQGVDCSSPPTGCYKNAGTCEEGKCKYEYDDNKDCNDNDTCTSGDKCFSGVCQGSPMVCNAPPKNECKNTNTLLVYTAPGFCSGGKCNYSSAEVPCAYGCDVAQGLCKGDPCTGITCNTPPNAICYSPNGICSNGQCIYFVKTSSPCDDNKPCTKNDACDANGTCAGTPYSCDDSLVCTIDACDGNGACKYTLESNSCLMYIEEDLMCFQGGAKNTNNACEYCNPNLVTDVWSVSTGPVLQQWDFEQGGLQGFTITPDPATSAVKWQLDVKRAVSPSRSLYFGDVSKHTYDDPGKAVNGEVTSPEIALPSDKGKLCVEFHLFKDTEMEISLWDQLTLKVLPPAPAQTVEVWRSGTEAYTAETYGEFVTFAADLSAFVGKNVKLQFAFDSYDSMVNTYEGIYIDDIRVLTNCTP